MCNKKCVYNNILYAISTLCYSPDDLIIFSDDKYIFISLQILVTYYYNLKFY